MARDARRRLARLEASLRVGAAWPDRPLSEWTEEELEAALRDLERGMPTEERGSAMARVDAMTEEELSAAAEALGTEWLRPPGA